MSELGFEELQEIYQKLPTAYGIIKPDSPTFTIISVNAAYRKLFKSSKEEFIGKSFSQIISRFNNGDQYEADIHESLIEISNTGEDNQTDIIQFKREESDDIYCTFKHTSVISDEGEIKYIVQTVKDVTNKLTSREKKEKDTQEISSRSNLHIRNETLTNQINRKIAQYESARKELDDFIYSVSHDLRAPLRRIDGFSQELMNEYLDQLDDQGAHYLKRVRQGAQDMGNLIDDLLKLSRISRREIEIEEIDLSKLAKSQFVKLFELESERDVGFQIEADLTVEADRGLAKAMLTNLLSNALKFTSKEDKAEIEVGSKSIDNETYYYIKDNGVGFDPTYSDKLFKAFDRLHSQKEFKGTGIGLATVKRIVNLHGGEIWAEGKPNEGATFYFKFQENNE